MTRLERSTRWAVCLVACCLLVPATVRGDDLPAEPPPSAVPAEPAASPATSNPETASEPESDESLLALVLKSGVTGWAFLAVLGLFSLVAATVAIERGVRTRRSLIVSSGFVAELKALVERREATVERFRFLCSTSPSPIAAILRAGLLRAGRPPVEAEKAMEDAAAREMGDIRARIRPLSVIGSIAPLIGLLGTVLGMIVAFRTASQAGLGKGELMAQGIYLALLTTAAGLSIAIPALILAAYFNARTEKLFREIDEVLMETLPTFARFEREGYEDARGPTKSVDRIGTAVEESRPVVVAAKG